LPEKYRRDLWMMASGAKIKKELSPDYYLRLLNDLKEYPDYFGK